MEEQAKEKRDLDADAAALLGLIEAAVVRRLELDAYDPRVKCCASLGGRIPSRNVIAIGGVAVPLSVCEHTAGSYMYRSTGRLEARCDALYGMDAHGRFQNRMNAKTFGYSAKRTKTFGFDVKKIAEHVVDWWVEHEKLKEIEQARRQRESSARAWYEDVLAEFPSLPGHATLDVEFTSLVLRVEAPHGDEAELKRLRRVLAALVEE